MAQIKTPVLPYPKSTSIKVYSDDGKWDNYSAWFMRRQKDLLELYIITYNLRTVAYDSDRPDDQDVDLTIKEWSELADDLMRDHPNCLFIYT